MANLIRIFYSPEIVFAGLREKPNWLPAVMGTMLLALCSAYMIVNMIGLPNMTRRMLENNPGLADKIPREQQEEMFREADSPARRALSYGMAGAGTLVSMLVVSGALLGLMKMTSADSSFRHVFAAVSHSFWAYTLIGVTISYIIVFASGDRANIDPRNLVALNPAAFMDQGATSPFLYAIAASLDLLSFYLIFLLSLGLSRVAKGLSFGRALILVLVPWAAWVLGKASLAALIRL
jgi:hypothetical protein